MKKTIKVWDIPIYNDGLPDGVANIDWESFWDEKSLKIAVEKLEAEKQRSITYNGSAYSGFQLGILLNVYSQKRVYLLGIRAD